MLSFYRRFEACSKARTPGPMHVPAHLVHASNAKLALVIPIMQYLQQRILLCTASSLSFVSMLFYQSAMYALTLSLTI